MTCLAPIPIRHDGVPGEASCGTCLNCRVRRTAENQGRVILAMDQWAQRYPEIPWRFTLFTYGDEYDEANAKPVASADMRVLAKSMAQASRREFPALGTLPYFQICEPGETYGRWHIHRLGPDLWHDPGLYSDAEGRNPSYRFWSRGFVRVETISNPRGAAHYLSAYLHKHAEAVYGMSRLLGLEPQYAMLRDYIASAERRGLGYVQRPLTFHHTGHDYPFAKQAYVKFAQWAEEAGLEVRMQLQPLQILKTVRDPVGEKFISQMRRSHARSAPRRNTRGL